MLTICTVFPLGSGCYAHCYWPRESATILSMVETIDRWENEGGALPQWDRRRLPPGTRRPALVAPILDGGSERPNRLARIVEIPEAGTASIERATTVTARTMTGGASTPVTSRFPDSGNRNHSAGQPRVVPARRVAAGR